MANAPPWLKPQSAILDSGVPFNTYHRKTGSVAEGIDLESAL
jgi:hypothetical protein